MKKFSVSEYIYHISFAEFSPRLIVQFDICSQLYALVLFVCLSLLSIFFLLWTRILEYNCFTHDFSVSKLRFLLRLFDSIKRVCNFKYCRIVLFQADEACAFGRYSPYVKNSNSIIANANGVGENSTNVYFMLLLTCYVVYHNFVVICCF